MVVGVGLGITGVGVSVGTGGKDSGLDSSTGVGLTFLATGKVVFFMVAAFWPVRW